jgi:hypothetical protein
MSEETPSASEQTPPEPTPQDLALNAAMAYRVKAWWAAMCDPIIKANAEQIRNTPGMLTTMAEVDGVRAATFTEAKSQPFFEIADPDKFFDWADAMGETEWVIRPSFENAILKKRARWNAATGEAVDSATGEVIPGVVQKPGGASLSVKPTFTDAGKERIDDVLDVLFGKTVRALPMLGPAPAAEDTEAGA